ncbi:peptidylprolyl isomerase [Chromobacterium violaceum]|uniref:Chaperone SurA n=3 Tax=Chromobacterium violaceum TaxID=536 RepID=SURA_CHRVO|nr:peptidylprolyl isomerase [Chromobacterium violaceum]Q7NQB0.1 RecName: Full=Chaperone SurA; AltName: Full=Peptidyl-prolyl cis-trans isomerase SurA; Short=PPIase SurA; AltName: Full=Rotamase SurA; Flags: Precursor [Chromobacterium violaceum ATCC 12472]AAQ61890.1 survival protein surA precursor [Chromobacterium violaceum ATCC 12472]MBA8733726.1 peptidylprolyl isomerase [Chromobacterium violaceum]MBP4047005.1 peptidylprolyl isomerase [Chromobacterium violaceum]MBP4051445.1 peptidylprolyl isomer
MKKTLLALLIASVMQSALAAPATPVREVDRIVAVVNKNVITWQELQARVNEAIKQLEAQKVAPPPREVLERQVLEQMITEEVQLQYAASGGLRIEDAAVDQAVANLAKQNKLSEAGLKAQLAKDGITLDRLRADIRRELTISRLRDSEVASRVNVSDSEVDQAMKSAQSANRTEYHLASILVAVPERADAKQIDQLSQKVHKAQADLAAGQPFAKVSAAYSDAPNALKGGDMGWRSATSLPQEFVQLLEQMKVGADTDVIRTQQGFFIFKLVDKRSGGAPMMVEQYHPRHILIRTNEAVSEADAKARIDQVRDRIMRGAKFADMAKLYSEDGSNAKGGDLGWVNMGDLVPEFEKAMVSLPIGQVSQPVRTPFGWHLILVEGKRNQDVSSDHEKMAVKQQIRARKMEQAYTDWVRQLRDSAFVEEHLDEK